MDYWYLIKTKPKQELLAKENLLNQGYSVYCPTFQIKKKKKPLFPRYLFVTINNNCKSLSPIRSTRGVINFVRFGVELAKININIINKIKSQESEIIDRAREISRPKNGDMVLINNGIFHGYQAIFEKQSDKDRVILLLKLLQQEQRIQFFNDQFEVI